MTEDKNEILILGGGLAGLSAGYILTKAGLEVKVFESDSAVGGLSKTIINDDFRFDLGGHRFFTKNRKIDNFVRELMGDELISVPRSSKIYLRSKFFDYPLKPINALFGFGIPTTLKIMCDYGYEKIRTLIKERAHVSLEDWVVSNFGRTMFNLYFREYSEKVWGIDCDMISSEWIEQRIKGLSLARAVKNALFRLNGKDIPTLADRFLYPKSGIGRISDRLKEEIESDNRVFTDSSVDRINHSGFEIQSIAVRNHKNSRVLHGKEYISSIPVTKLVKSLDPPAPDDILNSASKLRFRDLVIVALMINRERVTDQTWIYVPESKIPFGRIHEPKNWSVDMAPPDKTLVVLEFFSFIGDKIWNEADERLIEISAKNLEQLGFVKRSEIADGTVIRVPKAYPLFEVGYMKYCEEILDYLGKFKNLHITGRSGMFRYYNMDHTIESGISTAEKILEGNLYSSNFKDSDLTVSGIT